MDIQKDLESGGITLDRTAIKLDKPLKRSGKSEVEIKLHSEVTAILTVTVETAEKQDNARGEGAPGES